MNRYPTPLYFDGSSSAMIRFVGENLLEIKVHRIEKKFSQILMVCPDTVDFLDNKPCLLCSDTKEKIELDSRVIARGWDLHKERWCLYMAPHFVMHRIQQQIKAAGFTDAEINLGLAPDVILQRQRGNILAMVMAETAGKKRGKGIQPPWEDYLRGLQSRSVWAKYKRQSEVPERV